ncbi:hypothetical protein KCU64_g3360, partial [Aureobasidium melanogenum]
MVFGSEGVSTESVQVDVFLQCYTGGHLTPRFCKQATFDGAKEKGDLMANMLSQQHPTTPTAPQHGFGMPTPGTSASPWSTSAEMGERLQTAQREERRTVPAKKLKRIQEEQREKLRRAEEEEQERATH